MRAIVRPQYGGPEQLVVQNFPDPEPMPGHVVIDVKAFGINHAETYMRKGEWGEVAKVSGIECVGVVKASPDGKFSVGQKVAAIMGAWDARSTAATPNTPEYRRRMLCPLRPS